MILKLFIASFILLLGCAPKSTPVPTEFVISSMVQALATSSGGGLYFAGRSSTGEEFSLGLANAGNLNLVLNQGQWTFYTIAWAGPEPMTGEHRCDITQATLAPGNQTIAIELSKTKCIDGRFARIDADPALSAFMPNGVGQVFKKLSLNPCLDISRVSAQGQNCKGLGSSTYSHPLKGENLSFRISLRPRTLPGMESRRLMSACITSSNLGDFSDTFYATNLHLPMGGSFQGLLYDIHSYEDQNCTELEAIYRLPPLTRQVTNHIYRIPPSTVSQDQNSLYFTDNYVGVGAPFLTHKTATIGCGVNGLEHCFPAVPDPAIGYNQSYDHVSKTLENLLSNATDREAYTYGSSAFFTMMGGLDLTIKSTQPGLLFNEYSVEIMTSPSASPIDIDVNNSLKKISFLVNINGGTCSNPSFTDETSCDADSSTWFPLPTIYNADIVTQLNSFLVSNMPELTASTTNGGNIVEPEFIPLGINYLSGGRNPELQHGRLSSVLSRIAFYTSGPYISVLASEGITSCAAIPTGGAIERTFAGVENHSVRIEFGEGITPLPFWLNSGLLFEKRLRFISEDEEAIFEFSCNGLAQGFLRFVESEMTEEVFWNTDSAESAQIETYRSYNSPLGSGHEVTRFKKTTIQIFELISSQIWPAKNTLIKARGTRNGLWVNTTQGFDGAIDLLDVQNFETNNTAFCFDPNGEFSGSCAGIDGVVPINETPFYHNSWSTLATQYWNNPQFIDCPRNYIPVQGSSLLGTIDFCVMKYEARDDIGTARSIPDGQPWVSISGNLAKTKCQEHGANFGLISNPQWMTIAHQIELDPSNWVSGIVGSGSLFKGHTLSSPSLACDSLTEAVTGSCGNLDSDPVKRRIMNVGNSEIWDFAGNVQEWVDWDVAQTDKAFRFSDGSPIADMIEFIEIDTNNDVGDVMEDLFWKPFTPGLMNASGVGLYFAGSTNGTAIRGGAFNVDGGLYSLFLNFTATNTGTNIGFRCVYNP